MRRLDVLRILLAAAIFYVAVLSGEIIGDCTKVSADEIHSQRMTADPNQSGDALSYGLCYNGNAKVGDIATNNVTHRGFLSFDLNSLPREEIGEIVSVELDLSRHRNLSASHGGDPFGDLGNLQAIAVDLNFHGLSGSHCNFAYSMNGRIVYDRFGPPLTPINITDAFRHAYERRIRWFCLRLQFSRETDGDNTWDMAIFEPNAVSLTVRYLSPPPPVILESPSDGSIIRSLTPGPVLNWRRIPGVSSYMVQLSQSRDFASAPTYERYTNSFEPQPQGLENGRTYFWRVKRARTEWRATDSIWSFTVRVVPDMPWITTPPHGSRIHNRRPTFMWNAVPYAAQYELELREGSMSGTRVLHAAPRTTSFACPQDLSLNKRYVWIIKACNSYRECSGPAMGWFEVVLMAPEAGPLIPEQPPGKLPIPKPPVMPPVK